MSKSKTLKIAFHLAKICLEARFSTSLNKTSFALLQSTWTKKILFKRSSWNFEMHKTIDKISFLIVL
jgi:hypothetical protein